MNPQDTSLSTSFQYHAAVISGEEEVRKSIQKERVSIQVDEGSSTSSSGRVSLTASPNTRANAGYDLHTVSIDELERRFNTKLDVGLTSLNAEDKLRVDGPNVFTSKSYKWILDIIGYYFGGICLLLWPAVILCILAYQPFGVPNPDPTNLGLAVVIFVVILIQGSFGLLQDYSSSKVMKSINSMLPQDAVAIRDGKEVPVPIASLVTGDIVKIENGVRVPADLRLFTVQNLKLDTSMLTGESEPITCTTHSTDDVYTSSRNLAFMGCGVCEGAGYGMVIATGNATVMGKVAKLASGTNKGTSTLRKETLRMVFLTAVIAIITGVILVIYWAAYLRVRYPTFMTASAMIATVIGLIVAFVPEGFPLSLALTLTFIARSMKKMNVLVKKLSTVETLGSVNVIASDKTGTLTQNKMHVAELFTGLQSISAKASIAAYESNDESLAEMIRCLALCNRAEYRDEVGVEHENVEIISGNEARKTIIGDASDTAFLNYCSEFLNITSIRTRHAKLAEIPFNSKNKYMVTIVREDANTSLLFMKGAAEIILKRCVNILQTNGSMLPLSETMIEAITQQIESYAHQGKRVLAAAKLKLSTETMPPTYNFDTSVINFPMEELTFIGLVALVDPPRPDVPGAIDTLKRAGIKIAMVTGDHPTTAVSIARNVGIISKHAQVLHLVDEQVLDSDTDGAVAITGEQVAGITQEQWKSLKGREAVFARTTPEQKLLIVKAYQKLGCIVAATGDGTNDAPAMKQANVGISLGSGTEMAKESADIILLDNRFSSIAVGVKHGRLAFDNLRKIVTYVLPAGNWSEMIPIFLSAFMGIPIPLSAFLMIFICVGTDVGPTLALVTEPAEGDIMVRKPRVETKEKLVNIWLFAKAFLFLGSMECIGALTMFFIYFYWFAGLAPTDLFFAFDAWSDGYKGYTIDELNEFVFTGQSIYFIALVMMQIGQVLTIRLTRYNFYQQWVWKNPSLFIGILIELILAVGVIYIPIMNTLFKTRQPPVQFWFMPLVFSVIVFVMNEAWKGILRIGGLAVSKKTPEAVL